MILNQNASTVSSSLPAARGTVSALPASADDTRQLPRRTVLAGAAWSVPAISVLASTPAFAAASTGPSVAVSTPTATVPAAGGIPITVAAKDAQGQPLAGQPVTLTAPSPGVFSAANGVTDGAGRYTTTFTLGTPWAAPGSSVVVTAIVASTTASQPFVVTGSNALGWGYNAWAEMGDGGQAGGDTVGAGAVRTTASQLSTVFPSPVAQIVSCGTATGQGSNQSTLALLEDQSVWSVGGNGFGQLGDGTYTSRNTWARIPGLSGVTAIASGAESVYALMSDGTVKAWGDNWFGELGTGGTKNAVATPTTIPNLSDVTQVAAASQQVYFLLRDKTVLSLGRNAWGPENAPEGRGALGNGDSTNDVSATLVTVSGLTGVAQIAGGSSFGLALMADGSVRAWGNNSSGQLGDGTTTSRATAVTVVSASGSGSLTGVSALTANLASAYARMSDGTVRAWGKNAAGQLGDGTTTNSSRPVSVSSVSGADRVVASGSSAYVLQSDGTVMGWGQNSEGELADGTTTDRSVAVTVSGLGGIKVTTLMTSSPTPSRMFAVAANPSITATAPTQISAGTGAVVGASVRAGGSAVAGTTVTLSASGSTVLAASSGSTDSSGVFQTTATPDRWTLPGTALQLTAVADCGSSMVSSTVLGANALGFGLNQWAELGDGGAAGGDAAGSGVARSTPSQLLRAFSSPVKQIVSCGSGTTQGSSQSTVALLNDGSVWSVGGNGFGQLGTGGNSRTTWAMIPGLVGVQQISAGAEAVYALLSDGTVKAWGDNTFGQLGANASGSSSFTPVTVAGVSSVAQVSSGTQQCFFLLTDGTVRAIGRNTFGAALGDGSSVSQSASPVQVSGLTNVTQIAGYHQGGYAVKSDGTVWSWGSDYAGALGKGTTPVPPQWSAGAPVYASSTPVQVQGLSGKTVTQVAGNFAGGVVRTSDGAVFAWGDNTSGFVGDGTTTSRSSATAVSGLSSGVSRVTASGNSAYAMKSDGSVIAWGDNSDGQLGTGNTTNATTPVAVSGLSGLPLTGFMTNSPSTNRMYLYTGTATVTVDVDAQVSAGTAGAVVAKVAAGSLAVSGAPLSFAATNNAQLGSTSGTTDASGTYQTTVQMNRWTTPGLVSQVSATSNGSKGTGSFVSLGANALGFGLNQWAELGDGGAAGGDAAGSGVARSTPSQLLRAFSSPVKQIVSCGSGTTQGSSQSTVALLNDGSVWSVGGNGFGQLGTGGNSRTTWAMIPGLVGVQQISAGAEAVYALLSDGTVKAWGDNTFGQLGANASGSSSFTPVTVAGVSSVAQVSSGTQQCFFLLTDGTVRAIGRNTFGAALGDGSSVSQSASPVQVSGLTNVTQIAGYHQGGYAVKSDGTVWSWGSDYAGALGKGTTPVPPQWSAGAPVYASSTPVQVQGLSGKTVTQVAGNFAGGVVRTSDGAVFAWGDNTSGFVGDGTTTSRSSATAVSGLSSGVSRVTASGNSAYAMKSDGSVIAWGDNSDGQLGTGNTTNATTPVAVSGLSGLPLTGFMTNSPSTNRMYLYTAP